MELNHLLAVSRFVALAVWYMSDLVAPTRTAKTTLLDFSCWESSWPTTCLLMMPRVELNMTGNIYRVTKHQTLMSHVDPADKSVNPIFVVVNCKVKQTTSKTNMRLCIQTHTVCVVRGLTHSSLANDLRCFCVVCWCFRYVQSLTNNVSFVRYKEVYSAAAEIIGLILKNMTEIDNVWALPQLHIIRCVIVNSCQQMCILKCVMFLYFFFKYLT